MAGFMTLYPVSTASKKPVFVIGCFFHKGTFAGYWRKVESRDLKKILGKPKNNRGVCSVSAYISVFPYSSFSILFPSC